MERKEAKRKLWKREVASPHSSSDADTTSVPGLIRKTTEQQTTIPRQHINKFHIGAISDKLSDNQLPTERDVQYYTVH